MSSAIVALSALLGLLTPIAGVQLASRLAPYALRRPLRQGRARLHRRREQRGDAQAVPRGGHPDPAVRGAARGRRLGGAAVPAARRRRVRLRQAAGGLRAPRRLLRRRERVWDLDAAHGALRDAAVARAEADDV